MARFGVVVNRCRPEAGELVAALGVWADAHHHGLVEIDAADAAGGLDLAVSVGGDGTMLRTVNLVGAAGVPVLGVNVGTLGYLTVVEPDGAVVALERFLAGDYELEARMTLAVSVGDGGGAPPVAHCALNDVVLARPAGGHTVRVSVARNGTPFLAYAADSVIVATPTGSTAYNLSARGPVVAPRLRAQILTPVAPHYLFDRSVVLEAGDEVAVAPVNGSSADLVVDGVGRGLVGPGQVVTTTAGGWDANLVTFEARPFETVLKRKFDLGQP